FFGVAEPDASGVAGALGQLADVQKALDARLKLDERAEALGAQDLAVYTQARHIAGLDLGPRIARQRPQRQGDLPPPPRVDARLHLDDLDLQLLADGQHILRMARALKRQLAHMQHALEAAEIDESAVVLERRHPAAQHRANVQLFAQLGDALPRLDLEQ